VSIICFIYLHAFSSAMESCVVRSFWSSPQVILLGSWTTLLIILFTSLSEILRGAPGRNKFMVKYYGEHSEAQKCAYNNQCRHCVRLRRSWHILSWDVSCVTAWQWVRFVGHQLRLNQLILICADKGLDCFLIADSFQLSSWLSMLFPCVISHYYT